MQEPDPILPSGDDGPDPRDPRFGFFPFPLPRIGSMSMAEAYEWYFVTVHLIPGVVEAAWEAHANTRFECAWELRSRLRLAAALSLRDGTLAAEFLEATPLPEIESYLRDIGYDPEGREDDYLFEPWEYEAGVEKLARPYLTEDCELEDAERFRPENNRGLTVWDVADRRWVLTASGWEQDGAGTTRPGGNS